MTTNIDFKAIYNFISKTVMSKRGIALGICGACTIFAYNMITSRVVPMSYGADAVGADPTDLMATVVSVITAIVSFVASNYLGVNPEIIQAVIAFEKDKTNEDSQRRLGAAIVGYLVGVLKTHPDSSGGFVMLLLNTLIKHVPDDATKDALKVAATTMATNQFATNISVTPVKV